jgi:hypothetical protein
MSLFGDIPRQGPGWLGRGLIGALVGGFFGLFPALLLFAAVGGEDRETTGVAVALCLLASCVPMAGLFAFLAAWRGGRGLAVLVRWMMLRVRGW